MSDYIHRDDEPLIVSYGFMREPNRLDDEQATTIATFRAALTVIEAEHSAGDHPEWAGWYGEPGERPDLACRTCGTFGEYAVHWPCDTAKIAHAALDAVKETQG